MSKYVVQSGSLKIVLVAESALDAAIEAVQRWGSGPARPAATNHRNGFDERIVVQRGRASRQFPTFNVLAYARGESPAAAWRQLLERNVGNPN